MKHSAYVALAGLIVVAGCAVRLTAQAPAPSGALPFVESDPNRQPLRAGSLAPDFNLPLAEDCRWQPAAAATAKATATPATARPRSTLRFSSYRAARGDANGGANTANATIVVFWAFWCDTWKDTVQAFKAMRPRLDAAGARIAVVAVDASQQPVGRAALTSGAVWYPVVIDTNGDTTAHYGVRRVPTFFVVRGDGRIQARYEAFPGERALLQAVRDAGR